MNPVKFPEANMKFGPPPGIAESQVMTIFAHQGRILGGSMCGSPVIVTAWKPDAAELERLNKGEPLFLSFVADYLPPHFPCVDFKQAVNPA